MIHKINKKKMLKTNHQTPKCHRNSGTLKRHFEFDRSVSQLDGVADVAGVVPLDLALDILNLLELVTQLDDREVDHTRIETESAANR